MIGNISRAIIITILLPVVLMILVSGISTTYADNQYLVKEVITVSKAKHGYAGSPADIEVSVKGFKVKVHLNGADAYDLAVAVIGGLYDIIIHKWVAISGGHNKFLKDWCGFADWEQYHFKVTKDKGLFNGKDLIKIDDGDSILFKAGAKVLFKVTHCTWWCLQQSVWTDNDTVYTQTYIPKSRYLG